MDSTFASSPVPAGVLIELLLLLLTGIAGVGLVTMRSFFMELKTLVATHDKKITVLETEHKINHAVLVQGGRRVYDTVEIGCKHCQHSEEEKGHNKNE
jgi:hypothetical protein